MNPRRENSYRRSCLFFLFLFFVVLPFSLLALGLLLWYGREASGSGRLKARIASLAKQGYPVDDETCDKFYKDRTDPTNTNVWLEILATVQGTEFGSSTNGVPILGFAEEVPRALDTAWPEEKIARDFLEKWKLLSAETLRLSMDAKPVRFPIVFDSFNNMDVNRSTGMRVLARLINLQGIVALRDRNSAGVRDAIAGLLGLSRVSSGEPMVVSALVSIAIDGMAIGLLKDSLQFDVLSEADLQFLLPRTLALSTIGKDWETAFAGERALALPLFTDRKKAKSAGATLLFSNSRDAILYVDFIQAVLDASTDDLSEFKANLQAVESKLQAKSRANWLTQLDSIMTMQTTPAASAGGDAFIRRALQHRIAAIAIGLRLYEKKHGKFPNELQELADFGVNLEQVSLSKNQSFGYRSDGSKATIWGGTFRDAFAVPEEPPIVEPDSNGADPTGAEYWTWELRAK